MATSAGPRHQPNQPKGPAKRLQIRYTRPTMYDKQARAIFTGSRVSVIEASTKAGKTVGCLAWIFELALSARTPDANFWWVAPIYGQAQIAFRRLARWIPAELCTVTKSAGALTIRLNHNGATIWFKSGDNPDGLYGDDVWGVVIDEATRCKEDVFFACRSVVTATRGPMRIIGNVKGRKNWVHVLAMRALDEMRLAAQEGREPELEYHTLTAYDAVEAGVLAAEEIASAKRDLPPHIFSELYLAIPSDDGANPFGLQRIADCIMPVDEWQARQRLQPVVWGWDVARKVDWTVGVGLDEQRNVCRLVRWQKPWQEAVQEIARVSAGVPLLMDGTGVGDAVVAWVQTQHRRAEGFVFSPGSKQHLIESLALQIADGRPRIPAGVLSEEMESFEYVQTRTGVRYEAPEGLHDDAVCALALANEAWTTRKAGASGRGALVSL